MSECPDCGGDHDNENLAQEIMDMSQTIAGLLHEHVPSADGPVVVGALMHVAAHILTTCQDAEIRAKLVQDICDGFPKLVANLLVIEGLLDGMPEGRPN